MEEIQTQMKKTLNTLRIPEDLKTKMQQSQSKLNEMNITQISFTEFRRLCYEFFSNLVLNATPDKIRQVLQKK